MIRVAIIDDHQLFSEGLATALNALPDIAVIATFEDGMAYLDQMSSLAVDVLLLDLEMPTKSGLELLDEIEGACPAIIVSMHTGEKERKLAATKGASGFLSKATPLSKVAAAVRAVYAGHDLLDPTITLSEILERYQGAALDPGAASLTQREKEVLSQMAKGVTATDELADALYISQKTVKNHLASIYHKLAVSDRAQAVVEAIKLGLHRE